MLSKCFHLFYCYFRVIWLVLFGAAASSCVWFCVSSIAYFFTYPTKTTISTLQMGIDLPDITVCNHLAFDRTVLKRIDQIVMELVNTPNWNSPWELRDTGLASEIFLKAIARSFSKYQLFWKQYVFNPDIKINLSIRQLSSKIYLSLMAKQMMRAYMTVEEILEGGIPEWQILMSCTYGKYLSFSELNSIESTQSIEFVENNLSCSKMKITKIRFLQILQML